MASRTELEQQLWDFVYDLLSDEEAVALRERITSDPDVARCYADVKLQAEILAEASRIEQPAIALQRPVGEVAIVPRPAPRRGGRARASTAVRAANWLVSLAASALVGWLGYWYIRPDSPLRETAAGPAADAAREAEVRTVVFGPPRLQPHLPNYFTLVTAAADRSVRPTTVNYRLADANNALLANGVAEVNASGVAQIATPPELPATAVRLHVSPMLAGAELAPLQVSLPVAREELSTHVSTDKAAYQAGEAIRFRAVTLGQSVHPAAEKATVSWSFMTADGNAVAGAEGTVTANHGVAVGAVASPGGPAEGRYELVVRSPAQQFAEARTAVAVGQLTTLADTKNPTAWGRAGGAVGADADKLQKPDLAVTFFTESGGLVAGVPNRVYIASRDRAGQSVSVDGTIRDDEDQIVSPVHTGDRGRGRCEFVPEPGRSYRFAVAQPAGVAESFPLTAPRDGRFVTLIPESDVFPPQAALTLWVHSAQTARPLGIVAECRGAIVGQQLIDADSWTSREAGLGVYTLRLAVARQAAGVIRLTAYDYGVQPPQAIAERSVFRRPERRLDIRVSHVPAPAKAGANVQVAVLVRDENGQPQPATLGVTVADERFAVQPESRPPSLAVQHWLTSALRNAPPLADADFYLREDAAAALELDCLLGTEGRPLGAPTGLLLADNAPLGLDADAAAAQPALLAATAGAPQLLAAKTASVPQIADRAASSWRAVREAALNNAGRILAFTSLGLWIAVALLAVLRLTSGARVWVPAIGIATVCLILGGLWMRAEVDEAGQIAFLPGGASGRQLVVAESQPAPPPAEPAVAAPDKAEGGERYGVPASAGAPLGERQAAAAPATPALAATSPAPAAAAPPVVDQLNKAVSRRSLGDAEKDALHAERAKGAQPGSVGGGRFFGRALDEDRGAKKSLEKKDTLRKQAVVAMPAGELKRADEGRSELRLSPADASVAADTIREKSRVRSTAPTPKLGAAAPRAAPAPRSAPAPDDAPAREPMSPAPTRGALAKMKAAQPAQPAAEAPLGGAGAGFGRTALKSGMGGMGGALAESRSAPVQPAADQLALEAKSGAAPAAGRAVAQSSAGDKAKPSAQYPFGPTSEPVGGDAAMGAPPAAAGPANKPTMKEALGKAPQRSAPGITALAQKEQESLLRAKGATHLLARQRDAASGKPAASGILYWDPLLVTDQQGQATFPLTLPPSTKAFRVFVDGHTAERIGSAQATLAVGAAR